MDRNEWYRTGENIRDQVQQAVETGNFTNLGKNIGDTVNETLNHTVREMNRTVGTVGESVNRVVSEVGDSINRTVNDVTQGFVKNTPAQAANPYANLPQYRRPNARLGTRLFCVRLGIYGSWLWRDGSFPACPDRLGGGACDVFRFRGSGSHIGDFYHGGFVPRHPWGAAFRPREAL